MALAGTLEDLNFAEIVQAINQSRKTGELVVRRPQEEAHIFFAQGEIAQAEMKCPPPVAPIIGAEVIYRLMGWKDGSFTFERSIYPRTRLLTETTDELILEGMKRLDEWEKVNEEITDMNVVLRIKAGGVSARYDEVSDDARAVLRLVDARRDVAAIIRESGFDPNRALLAVTELITEGMVEKWEQAQKKAVPISL
jgi:hypothetical protein